MALVLPMCLLQSKHRATRLHMILYNRSGVYTMACGVGRYIRIDTAKRHCTAGKTCPECEPAHGVAKLDCIAHSRSRPPGSGGASGALLTALSGPSATLSSGPIEVPGPIEGPGPINIKAPGGCMPRAPRDGAAASSASLQRQAFSSSISSARQCQHRPLGPGRGPWPVRMARWPGTGPCTWPLGIGRVPDRHWLGLSCIGLLCRARAGQPCLDPRAPRPGPRLVPVAHWPKLNNRAVAGRMSPRPGPCTLRPGRAHVPAAGTTGRAKHSRPTTPQLRASNAGGGPVPGVVRLRLRHRDRSGPGSQGLNSRVGRG